MALNSSNWSLFNPHKKIERQTIIMGVSAICLLGAYGYSHVRIHKERTILMQTVDSVGATSKFSKSTNTSIKLGRTYLSKDGKSAYIPLTFSSLNQVGITANDYRIYVGASSSSTMDNKVKGQLIMYGSNNRAVVALHSTTRIVNQPLNLYVLNTQKVATLNDSDKVIMNNANDGTKQFGKYDVAAFKINPGSTDSMKNTRVPSKITSAQVIYTNVFGEPKIRDIENKIAANKVQVKKYSAVAMGIIQRLRHAGFKVPSAPAWMSNSWRPFDAINVATGQTANGKSVNNYNPYNANDQDTQKVTFPDNLKNIHGGNSSSNTNTNQQTDNGETTASQQWTNLQTAWLKVESIKRDSYVYQQYKLYKIMQDDNASLTQSTVSHPKQFVQISKVKGE